MAVRKRIFTYFLKVARAHSCMKLFQCKSCQLMDKTLNYHFMKKNHTYIVNYKFRRTSNKCLLFFDTHGISCIHHPIINFFKITLLTHYDCKKEAEYLQEKVITLFTHYDCKKKAEYLQEKVITLLTHYDCKRKVSISRRR